MSGDEAVDLDPSVPSDTNAAAGPVGEEPDRHRVPNLAWVALAALAVAALSIPFFRGNSVLADDFSTPDVLRTWPENGATLVYDGGRYKVSVLEQRTSTVAYHGLPKPLGGLSLDVVVDVAAGSPAIVIGCLTAVQETSNPDGRSDIEFQDGYDFFLRDGGGGIARAGDALTSGAVSLGADGHVTIGCEIEGGTATLTLSSGGSEPLKATDADASGAFVGIYLGVYSKATPASVTFDDLRVDKT